jgi:hypothetical protein
MRLRPRAKSLSLIATFPLAAFVVRWQESRDDVLAKIRSEAHERIVLTWFTYQAASMDQPLARVSTE